MTLSPTQQQLLHDLASGATLKSHRYLDGRKVYQLHWLDGRPPQTVRRSTVAAMQARGLIFSNQKFPAATYMLTEAAHRLLANEGVGGTGAA